jgi:hypothetical protein
VGAIDEAGHAWGGRPFVIVGGAVGATRGAAVEAARGGAV